jgi:hypothetical protein
MAMRKYENYLDNVRDCN